MQSRVSSMKTAAIISKPAKDELTETLPRLVSWLKARNYRVIMDQQTSVYGVCEEVFPRYELGYENPTLAIVLGGDGTLLSAARAVSRQDVPILAVNLGSLGFLTEVPLQALFETLESIDEGSCPVEARSVLETVLRRGEEVLKRYYALNDVVVGKTALARLISFNLHVDGVFVYTCRADALIVSTPTGSTAYSLAAGGPVVVPSAEAFVISPVSPHSLTHRPLVLNDKVTIQIQLSPGEEGYLSIDGQVGFPITPGEVIECRRAQHDVKLFRRSGSYFEVLHDKLKWGER